jgi:UDP-N-acetylglucosamine acyltransferase
MKATQIATKCGIDNFHVNHEGTCIHRTAIIAHGVEIGRNVYIGPYAVIGYPAEKKGSEDAGRVLINDDVQIHGSCTIDSGTNGVTVIGHKSYIMKGVHVGHDAMINTEVTISPGAKIGGHANIGTLCNIGMNAVVHQFVKIPAGCMIGMGAIMVKNKEYKAYHKYINVGQELGENVYLIEKMREV